MPFQLTDDELRTVAAILKAHLPPDAQVWVYGSRVRGTAHRTSDLDLALDVGQPLPFSVWGFLSDAFDASSLAFRVDLTDVHSCDPVFLERIQREWVPWPQPSG